MPSKQTQNYHLSQWEPEDAVKRTDFNADNAAIDAAIKEVDVRVDGKADASALTKEISERTSAVSALQSTLSTLQNTVKGKQDASGAVKFAAGTYTGTTEGDSATLTASGSQTISVGFKPKAVLVMPKAATLYDPKFNTNVTGEIMGGLAVTDGPVTLYGRTALELTNSGFTVHTSWSGISGPYVRLNDKGSTYYYIALG